MNYNSLFKEFDYFTNLNPVNSNNLYGPYEGYLRGNLFSNLYTPYKDLNFIKIPVKNEQEELLLNLNQIAFARHELNLLLDVYPNKQEILNLFTHYQNLEEQQKENYERRFGPLCISSQNMDKIPFAWENDTWPWEM